jgi:hypothetical protein
MKTRHYFTLAILVGLVILTMSCNKKSNTDDDNAGETKLQLMAHQGDQAQFSAAQDQMGEEINLLLEAAAFAGRPGDLGGLICNASIEIDSLSEPRTITVTYSGLNCAGTFSRSGQIILSAASNTNWANAGAAISVSCDDLRITRVADNRFITLNGTQTYTNVSGGLLINLANTNGIEHRVSSDGIEVAFDDNTVRSWKVARKRWFTYQGGVVLESSGYHSENGISNIAEWGTTRFGNSFCTSSISPVTIRQDCAFRITSGEIKHQTDMYQANVEFGLNSTGSPSACPGNGQYYYQLSWLLANGANGSVIVPY